MAIRTSNAKKWHPTLWRKPPLPELAACQKNSEENRRRRCHVRKAELCASDKASAIWQGRSLWGFARKLSQRLLPEFCGHIGGMASTAQDGIPLNNVAKQRKRHAGRVPFRAAVDVYAALEACTAAAGSGTISIVCKMSLRRIGLTTKMAISAAVILRPTATLNTEYHP